ncbi:MAG TPA: toll/interleukin-1 receptor domain-containing protein [Rhizomicrobium sp.]
MGHVVDFEYDAFISFAWKDIGRAQRLHERLAARGYITWYAEKNLRAGDDLFHRISEGMARSRYLFVIHSGNHARGKWANRELSAVGTDEIESGLTKVVCLKYDDTELPLLLRSKLYVDFRTRKPGPFEQLCGLLDESSDAVIKGTKANFLKATDINEIRNCAHRLSAMARGRHELGALRAASEILLSVPENYNVGDSAAWVVGDVGVWMDSDEVTREIMQVVPQVVATGDARLINHMAYICGEMALQAKSGTLQAWAGDFIAAQEASPDASVREPFQFTRERIGKLKIPRK